MNILIIRVSAIGDVIHTFPAIFLIKKVYPNAKISWIVQQKASDLLINQDFLENVYVLPDKFLYPKNWKIFLKKIKEIRTTKWDVILDFQGILKSLIILLFLKGEKYGFDFNNVKLWLTSFFTSKHTKPIYTNIIQKNLALVSDMIYDKKIGDIDSCPTIDNFKNLFKLKIHNKNQQIVDEWLIKNKIILRHPAVVAGATTRLPKLYNKQVSFSKLYGGQVAESAGYGSQVNKFIILAPNTTWASKHWPENNWFQTIKLLLQEKSFIKNYSIILIGKDFGNQAMNLAKQIEFQNLNVKISPKWNLITTYFLISKSNLLIAPDTGLLHIADFLDKKTIGIFGPTLAKKHGPFLNKQNIKNAIQIKCPHHYEKTHGKQKNNMFKDCMYQLTPEALFKKISEILKIK